jgi:hypothetical protein
MLQVIVTEAEKQLHLMHKDLQAVKLQQKRAAHERMQQQEVRTGACGRECSNQRV